MYVIREAQEHKRNVESDLYRKLCLLVRPSIRELSWKKKWSKGLSLRTHLLVDQTGCIHHPCSNFHPIHVIPRCLAVRTFETAFIIQLHFAWSLFKGPNGPRGPSGPSHFHIVRGGSLGPRNPISICKRACPSVRGRVLFQFTKDLWEVGNR